MRTSLRPAATTSPRHRSRPRVNDRPHPKTRPSGQHPRRQFLRLAAGAAALPAVSRIAGAQTYPTRPITMIVPIGAGSVSDLVARVVADRMAKSLGQPIIIENVSGADGSIGVGRAARAAPNGYTILYGFASAMVLNAAFYSLPYDVLKDFAPISPVPTRGRFGLTAAWPDDRSNPRSGIPYSASNTLTRSPASSPNRRRPGSIS